MATAFSSHRGGPSTSYRPTVAPSQPPGTFLPGTKVQVGSQRVVIEKYLSEGGFAHVYTVHVPREGGKHELAVLKRVAVPDKDHLASMRTEVETMKKLKGHKKVVTYMDSHASQLKGGGYEVFLLMEYCAGGGLIDFMNTRLQHRLTEPEILKIFGDVAEGVACMHYLKPPLLHRDLKVENVLISKSSSPRGDGTSAAPIYKICDFGSTAAPRPAAKTAEEGRLIEEDVQKHTTMQYRSPEMIDVWRKQSIDEKADIWALGVLLYKLCYYTTPFEDVGQMAILNASYKYPAYPSFSDRLKKFIAWMLKEDPRQRPNIYQVVSQTCSMQGRKDVPIKDIYAERTQSEAHRNESLPSSDRPAPIASPPASGSGIGLQRAAPEVQVQALPDITPMRRGRPTAPAQQAPVAAAAQAKPSASPARGDPFAALDSKSFDVRAGAVDKLSKRFPSLDEFSIAHETSGNFPFAVDAAKASQSAGSAELNERVAQALADEVFGSIKSPPLPAAEAPTARSMDMPASSQVSLQAARGSPEKSRVAANARQSSQQSPLTHQPAPLRPGMVGYRSTGVGSSPPPPQKPARSSEINKKPIWRVPAKTDHDRSTYQPRASEAAQADANRLQPPSQRPVLSQTHRSKSQTSTLQSSVRSPTSSRPSLEGHRPSQLDLNGESGLNRAKSTQSRQRPSSVYVSSNLDFLRDQESSRTRPSTEIKRPSMDGRRHSRQASRDAQAEREQAAAEEAEKPTEGGMDYQRDNEESSSGGLFGKSAGGRKSGSSGQKKRTSLPSISGAKNIFAGRFGDAFKRFESNAPERDDEDAPTTPEAREREEPRLLSPIQGSEATQTPSNYSQEDRESAVDETEDLPPDLRRELERRRLSTEEKRVAEAAAEYRLRLGNQGTGSPQRAAGPTRASTIQKRVQSLLDEGRQSPVQARRTAEGYGKYTDTSSPNLSETETPAPMPATVARLSEVAPAKAGPPPLARKPMPAGNIMASNNPYPKTREGQNEIPAPSVPRPPASAPPAQQTVAPAPMRTVSRPSVPPKSQALRTGGGALAPQWPPQQQQRNVEKPLSARPTDTVGRGLAALLAKDMEGVPEYPPRGSFAAAPTHGPPPVLLRSQSGGVGVEDLEADFSKRYPSLAGIEMVETEIGGGGSSHGSGGGRPMRVKEV